MKVFLSYQMEDAVPRDDFSCEVAGIEQAVIFLDYPKVNYFDPKWQQRCSELIRKCAGTVVLIGTTTYQSQPVVWEITETKRQGLPTIGVILHDTGLLHPPDGLGQEDLIPVTDIDAVVSQIRSWRA